MVTRKKKAKKRKDVGCPNTHLRKHLCLTVKQVESIKSTLKSCSLSRSTEKERVYLLKILATVEEQTR